MNCTVAEVVTSDDLGGADEVTIKMGGEGGAGVGSIQLSWMTVLKVD